MIQESWGEEQKEKLCENYAKTCNENKNCGCGILQCFYFLPIYKFMYKVLKNE